MHIEWFIFCVMFWLYTLIDVFFYYFVMMNLNADFCAMIVVWGSFIWLCLQRMCDMFIYTFKCVRVFFVNAWSLYYVCVFKTFLWVMTKIWYVMFVSLCVYDDFCEVHYLMCSDFVWQYLLLGFTYIVSIYNECGWHVWNVCEFSLAYALI